MPPKKYFRPSLNERVTIALKSMTPEPAQGRYGKQWKWTLSDGRELYTPLIVKAKIDALNLKPGGQRFTLVKESKDSKVEWNVFPAPQGAVELLEQTDSRDSPVPLESAERKPPTRLEYALKTAVSAAHEAEQEGAKIGYSVRFAPADIRAMAISILISQDRRTA